MASKISLSIKCKNIAPIESLDKTINVSSLKIGIFANNGSGKTFISRLFRLLEPELNYQSTDSLIRFGTTKGNFSLLIKDKDGIVKEDLSLDIKQNELPDIPQSKYIYHTFNQDYVEENIRALSFEKDNNIQGFILGKTQIDLAEDEAKLDKLNGTEAILHKTLVEQIRTYINESVDPIRDITRLQEYKDYLNVERILNSNKENKINGIKSIDEYINDYKKIKSVPETLSDISIISKINTDLEFLSSIVFDLEKTFTLSSFAEDFKAIVRNKQLFLEQGIQYLHANELECPFCGQSMTRESNELIDRYTQYLCDEETKIRNTLENYETKINNIVTLLKDSEQNYRDKNNEYLRYVSQYFPMMENIKFEDYQILDTIELLQSIVALLHEKITDIRHSIAIDSQIPNNIIQNIKSYNDKIEKSNNIIIEINSKKNKIKEENKNVRRNICIAAHNHILDSFSKQINEIIQVKQQSTTLKDILSKKKEKEKINKKDKIYETIKKVLDYFFSGKYSLEKDTFRLIFEKQTLQKDQTKEVLSEGEKNIIAFAYYLGDAHIKIHKKEDYDRLFFIIDDPISSMDFTYVYTVSSVIRGLDHIVANLQHPKFIIFTHNNDFMRIICSNNVVDSQLLLNHGEITEFNENFSVPYISHLIDICHIANGQYEPTHTTANSIRHIIETLTKFQYLDVSSNSIKDYIEQNFDQNPSSYMLINDLSHGGWRSEQSTFTKDDYKELCSAIVNHITTKFPKQIEYCSTI